MAWWSKRILSVGEDWAKVTTRKEKNGRFRPTAAFTPATPTTSDVSESSSIKVYQLSSGAS